MPSLFINKFLCEVEKQEFDFELYSVNYNSEMSVRDFKAFFTEFFLECNKHSQEDNSPFSINMFILII